jgi:hypothetical protein
MRLGRERAGGMVTFAIPAPTISFAVASGTHDLTPILHIDG